MITTQLRELWRSPPLAVTMRDANVSEQDLIEFCLDRLATFKVPRYVRFVSGSEWPMSGTKILRQ